MAKKKKSIYSRRLKDVNKDGKRNFGDTWLGDLIGADGKVGIGEGRPGLKESLKGARREKPITKKPKKKPPVGKKPKRKPKSEAKPNVRVGIKTSTSVVAPLSDRHSGAGRASPLSDRHEGSKPTKKPKAKPNVRSGIKTSTKVDTSEKILPRVRKDKKSDNTIPKDPKTDTSNQDSRKKFISPVMQDLYDYFYPKQDSGAVKSVVKGKRGDRKRNRDRTGNSKGGMIDYRKTGMFYGGMTKRGKK
tara:strand:+ start:555 stop:1292 length:738 start_codon:yes stop_codon:yes gene_type:complete